MQNVRRKPGMLDVARLAGVSHQTVSRVLNNDSHVRPSTRAKVLAAVEELGYMRNMAARELVTKQSGLIGVVSTGSSLTGPLRTTSAIEVAARAAGFSTLVGVIQERSHQELASIIEGFMARGVEGIVIVAPQIWIVERARRAVHSTPTVIIADMPEDPEFHIVAVDQAMGATLATRLLIARGMHSIAHVSGPLDWFDAIARAAGWRRAMEEAGLSADRQVVGDWRAERGYEIGSELAYGPLPEAVFCANDQTALGLIAAFRDLGVAVPDAVSVIGFDDMPGAAYLQPPLTTLEQPFEHLASKAIEALVAAMKGQSPAKHSIAPLLHIRRSTR